MLWALGQPAAAVGLAGGFLLALGLRVLAQRGSLMVITQVASRQRLRPNPRTDIDPIGVVAAVLAGTGWGNAVRRTDVSRRGIVLTLLAGPAAVLAASQFALYAFARAYPGNSALTLNRPSDILRGVVAHTMAAQLLLSAAVGLLCFGLVALAPIPPLDGFRLARLALSDSDLLPTPQADRLGAFILLVLAVAPIADGLSPLLIALDAVGTPLLRAWT